MKKTGLFMLCLAMSYVVHAQQIVQVTTLAGSGVAGNANGKGTAASFSSPIGLSTDPQGNVYVADLGNHSIRKITPQGDVSTLAGSGMEGYAEGQGTAAQFNAPLSVCIDENSNLFVGDAFNYRIRKITPAGTVSTFAGSGQHGYVEGVGTTVQFIYPSRILYGPDHNFYVLDEIFTRGAIRKITAAGKTTELYNTNRLYGEGIHSICIDRSGNLFFTTDARILKMTPSGEVTTYAGRKNAPPSYEGPRDNVIIEEETVLTVDSAGNIYFGSDISGMIRKIDNASGSVTIIAGAREKDHVDAAGKDARFKKIKGITIDSKGNLYISDDNYIRKIEFITPAPPKPNYLDLPSSLCMGSTINKLPSTIGTTSLKLDVDSIIVPGAKAVASGKNGEVFVVNAGDSVLRYSSNGTLLKVYNDLQVVTHIKDIAVDSNNRVYVIGDGWNAHSVFRLDSSGNADLGFSSPQFYFTGPTALAISPDGYIYVSDTLNGNVDKMDPVTGVASFYAGPTDGLYKITDVDFDKEGRMYLTSKGYQKILFRQANSSDPFKQLILGLDTMKFAFDKLSLGLSAGSGMISLTSSATGRIVQIETEGASLSAGEVPISNLAVWDYDQINIRANRPAGSAFVQDANGLYSLDIANNGNNSVKRISIYNYTITPSLPAGLSFSFLSGRIVGTPLAPAPAATYTVTVHNAQGTGTYKFSFSVDPPGPVSNAVGTHASKTETQGDGFVVNYFETNNCAELMTIEDQPGGTVIGKVQVNQTVYPTIATFSSGAFVPRVNDINVQNTDAEARLKLYYTFLDIEHFNQSNGTDPDLDNDTIKGTMKVGVLQLHKDSTGRSQQIKHNPVTATWSKTKHVWVVDFKVDKFSAFYLGETNTVASFNCMTMGDTQSVSACGNYVWRGKLYSATGIYHDTTANRAGCDSVLTLNLKVTTDMAVTRNADVLTSNASGAVYQWVYCDSGYAAISGATSQAYTAKKKGSYAVIVTKNSCTDTSDCIYVDSVSTVQGLHNDILLEAAFRVYPNPSTGTFTLDAPISCCISIYNVLGEVVLERTQVKGIQSIDLNSYNKGVYFINIQTTEGCVVKKLIRN